MIRDATDPDAQLGPGFPRLDGSVPDAFGAAPGAAPVAAPGAVPSSHPMHALDEARNRALADAAMQRADEGTRRKRGLHAIAVSIIDGTGPQDLATLEAELAKIPADYAALRQLVDQLIASRDTATRVAEIDAQECERDRAQRAALAADEGSRAAELQRVLAASGAMPVNVSETSRNLREGSCSQPTPVNAAETARRMREGQPVNPGDHPPSFVS